ncbi:hypothetical protein SAMN04489712_103211 [Thermomonospora echinospora]|uniref:Uncharacterized protein n=1 Tax=Thermomonospora echinospora TaxID=1992 RepID=A0A1H5XDZ4_9ACTN|nr:hypothetical protein SAMN04489712_103211 [Thermomonospora echinospora]
MILRPGGVRIPDMRGIFRAHHGDDVKVIQDTVSFRAPDGHNGAHG